MYNIYIIHGVKESVCVCFSAHMDIYERTNERTNVYNSLINTAHRHNGHPRKVDIGQCVIVNTLCAIRILRIFRQLPLSIARRRRRRRHCSYCCCCDAMRKRRRPVVLLGGGSSSSGGGSRYDVQGLKPERRRRDGSRHNSCQDYHHVHNM